LRLNEKSEKTQGDSRRRWQLMRTGPPLSFLIARDWVKAGDGWKGVPDNKIYLIDLTVSAPAQIATVEAGKQASGMAMNRAGTLALVANRADDSVTVLAIDRKTVKPVGTVSVATKPPSRPPRCRNHPQRCLWR
jgi:hypothetical protein